MSNIFLLHLFVALTLVAGISIPKLTKNWSVNEPAFLLVADNNMFVTSFSGSPFTSGSISCLFNVSNAMKSSGAPTFTTIVPTSAGLLWPNEMTRLVPKQDSNSFIFGDGFLVPGKSTGSLSLVSATRNNNGSSIPKFSLSKLTVDKPDWFYHVGKFIDVNGDGQLDIVTARGLSHIYGGGAGELIWLEAPNWVEHHIVDGPDINFDILPLNGTSAPFIVFAAEFFGQQLSATQVELHGVVSQRATIDNSIGEVYTAVVVDLSNSGKPTQVLVTNYVYSGHGSMYLYDIGQLSNPSSFTRTTVYDQFQNVQWAPGSGAPGFVFPHNPTTKVRKGDWQNIFVSGDGSQTAYLFAFDSTAGAYKLAFSKQYQATVGFMSISDFDGNGYNDVAIALYDTNHIEVFSYH